jgi:hypothetical protein
MNREMTKGGQDTVGVERKKRNWIYTIMVASEPSVLIVHSQVQRFALSVDSIFLPFG